ncbi:MAG TPA: HAD family hydrolase [Gemmatimonadales bacterium]|jgi:phosphoglycolate phosphatase-like HAD superfamily hydrolase
MKRRLVLFDIDGTLLTSMRAGWRALRSAFEAEYDDVTFFEQVRFDGKTDYQIVAELHHAAGRPERATNDQMALVIDRYLGHLDGAVRETGGGVQPCPGVPELLDVLARRDDVVTGLLTGNVVPGARIKLAAAGLSFDRFTLGAFGSDSAHRPDLPAIAAERAAALFGHLPHGNEVVIIGDTPADVACGAGISARAIAVATGSYTVAQLQETPAYAVFATLAETAAVVDAIVR